MRNLLTGFLLAIVINQAIITPKYYGETTGDTIPVGSIILTTSSCGTGFTEVSGLDGQFLLGTVASHSNVGTTGGSNSITPAGTNGTGTTTATGTINTPTLSWPAGVPTHSGTAASFTGTPFSSIINHTHTLTITSTSRLQGGTTAATTGTHIMTSTATGGSARAPTSGDLITGTTDNPSGGVASITPAGSVSITNQGTIAWPAGVPTSNALTFTGSSSVTSAQTFTGAQFDNRPAFTRVIFCQKS